MHPHPPHMHPRTERTARVRREPHLHFPLHTSTSFLSNPLKTR
jgi:hypothetical protein